MPRVAVDRVAGDSKRERDGNFVPGDLEGVLLDVLLDRFREHLQVFVGVSGPGEAKLVSAVACHQHAFGGFSDKSIGDMSKDRIARQVTICIIKQLKVV